MTTISGSGPGPESATTVMSRRSRVIKRAFAQCERRPMAVAPAGLVYVWPPQAPSASRQPAFGLAVDVNTTGGDTTEDVPWTFLLQYIEKGLELIVKLVRSAIAETSQYVPYQELPVAGPADTDVRWTGAAALIALAIALASLWLVLWRTRPRTRPGAAPPLVTGGVSWRRVE